jgi:DNA-directed RNA polymerase subunit RPC12/RpoP
MFKEVNITCPTCGHSFLYDRVHYQSGTLFNCENTDCQVVLSRSTKSIRDDLKETSVSCPVCSYTTLIDLNTVKTFDCPSCDTNIF